MGVLFGSLPAFSTSAAGAATARRGGGQSAAGRGSLQRTLIAVEVALSIVLLVGAALLAKSLSKLTAVDPGFRATNLVALRLTLPSSSFDSATTANTQDDILARLAALPNVEAVTAVGDGIPFGGGHSSSGYYKESDPEVIQRRRSASQLRVLPNYFATVGVPVLAGRPFSSADRAGAPLVAIVSEIAARRDWPNESPLGQRVKYQGEWRTIVGVVADVHSTKLSSDVEPTIYTPHAQRPGEVSFLVRTRVEPIQVVSSLRSMARASNAAVVVISVDVIDDLIRRSFSEERFRTVLIVLFGAIAGGLAGVGMYGVTARAVTGRTRELSIRVALGASTGSVVRLIMGGSLAGVVIGVAAGTVAAIGANRLLVPYLFGVNAHDPIAYAGIVGGLAAVSIFTSWIPARRAGRVAPAVALRGE